MFPTQARGMFASAGVTGPGGSNAIEVQLCRITVLIAQFICGIANPVCGMAIGSSWR